MPGLVTAGPGGRQLARSGKEAARGKVSSLFPEKGVRDRLVHFHAITRFSSFVWMLSLSGETGEAKVHESGWKCATERGHWCTACCDVSFCFQEPLKCHPSPHHPAWLSDVRLNVGNSGAFPGI